MNINKIKEYRNFKNEFKALKGDLEAQLPIVSKMVELEKEIMSDLEYACVVKKTTKGNFIIKQNGFRRFVKLTPYKGTNDLVKFTMDFTDNISLASRLTEEEANSYLISVNYNVFNKVIEEVQV
jgi:hypothetical protein